MTAKAKVKYTKIATLQKHFAKSKCAKAFCQNVALLKKFCLPQNFKSKQICANKKIKTSAIKQAKAKIRVQNLRKKMQSQNVQKNAKSKCAKTSSEFLKTFTQHVCKTFAHNCKFFEILQKLYLKEIKRR